MKKFSLVEFSVDHPKLIVALSIILTLLFLTQFTKVRTDTNPKNMLPPTSDVSGSGMMKLKRPSASMKT